MALEIEEFLIREKDSDDFIGLDKAKSLSH